MMNRILLLGKNGQLGWEAWRVLSCLGEVIALDYPEVDFTSPLALRELVSQIKPQIIYNAVAYTAVDRAESEIETCRLINAVAPGILAEAAREVHAVLVHFSTDYIFDGAKGSAYVETDTPYPLNVYGQTKLEGEQAVKAAGGSWLIFRTSWVYSTRRDSFISKVLEWAAKSPSLRIVEDQVSGPTWARALAEITGMVLARGWQNPFTEFAQYSGVYHLAGWGWASRKTWAEEILRLCSGMALQSREILPAKTNDFPAAANRPLFSALDCSKFQRTFGLKLPEWQAALALAMNHTGSVEFSKQGYEVGFDN